MVPFSDKLTVQLMQNLKPGESLCTNSIPESGGFFVCPVSRDCMGIERRNDSYVPLGGDSSSSSWFTGTGGRTWDFCAPNLPAAMVGNGLPVPVATSSLEAVASCTFSGI